MRFRISLSCGTLDGVFHQEKDPYWWLLWLTQSLTIHGSPCCPSCHPKPEPRVEPCTPAAAHSMMASENGMSDWEMLKPLTRVCCATLSPRTRPAKQCQYSMSLDRLFIGSPLGAVFLSHQ